MSYSTQLLVHRITHIRVTALSPDNSNAITLVFEGQSEGHTEEALKLTVFDLPKEITNKLMLAFSDERTTVSEEATDATT